MPDTIVNLKGVTALDFPSSISASIANGIASLTGFGGGGGSSSIARFWGYFGSNPQVPGSTAGSLDNINTVYVWPMNVLGDCSVASISFLIITGASSKFMDFGLYDTSGSLVVDTGAFDTTGIAFNSTPQNVPITPVAVAAGEYYFAMTGDSASISFQAVTNLANSSVMKMLSANGTPKVGTGANPSVAGALPATLGAISQSEVSTIPFVLFEEA